MRTKLPLPRRRPHAFTIIEVTLSLIVLLMMTLMFAAALPFVVQQAQASNNYNQATLLVQHKIDQVRAAGYGKMNASDLTSLAVINGVNPDGSYDFTTVDGLTGVGGFFPAGTTGTIRVSPYAGTGGTVDYVTVTVQWPRTATPAGSYSGSTMVIQMTHS